MADEKLGALTTRDLSALSLESQQLDSYPTRGFQDFLVTLPTVPNFPFEIQHNLSAAKPTGVRFEVLQSTYPTVLYHDPRDVWGGSYVVLRATSGEGAQIRVRLTVDDGDADDLLEGTSRYTQGFKVQGPMGTLSADPLRDNSAVGLDLAAFFTVATNASNDGPAVQLGDDAAGMGWQMSADMGGFSTGLHRLRFIPTSDSATNRYAAQLSQDPSSPVAGEYYLTGGPTVNSKLYLGGPLAKFGTGFRIVNIYASAADIAGTVTLNNIQFPATQVASSDANNLDDYEEGTWTPTIISTGGGTPTYSTQAGRYTKVGQKVFVQGRVTLSAFGTLAAGSISIGGLPFTVNGTHYSTVHMGYFAGWSIGIAVCMGYFVIGSTNISVTFIPAAGGTIASVCSKADIGAFQDFLFSGHYTV